MKSNQHTHTLSLGEVPLKHPFIDRDICLHSKIDHSALINPLRLLTRVQILMVVSKTDEQVDLPEERKRFEQNI